MSTDNIDFNSFGDYNEIGETVDGNASTNQQVNIIIILSLVICIIGLVGNLVAILLLFVLKNYKNSVTHWYVLQLAFANSLFLLTLPFKVSEDLNDGFIYPELVCKAKETVIFMNYFASILFLMIMSIDRYIAVCHTFSYGLQKLRNNTSALIIILFTWAISLLLCIPVMLYSYKIGIPPNCRCHYEFPNEVNHTALCLEEGFNTKESLEKCLLQNNKPLYGSGEKHCQPIKVQISIIGNNFPSTSNDTDSSGWLTNLIYGSGDFSGDFAGDFAGDYSSDLGNYVDTLGIPKIPASCHYWERPSRWIAFIAFNFAVFLLLFIIVIIFYGLIACCPSAKRMVSSNNPSTSSFTQSNTGEEKHLKSKKSPSISDRDNRLLTIMCAALAVSFIICWIPFHASDLAKIVGIKTKNICEILPIIGSLLAYLSSALNPYIYIFLGPNITRICKRKNKNGNLEFENKQSFDAPVLLKETQSLYPKLTVPNDDTTQGSSLD